MKTVNLRHKSIVVANREMKKHGDDCKLDAHKDVYFIECYCDEKVVDKKKEVRKDIIDEIDANGNGRLTKKEIKDWINKDK